MTGPLALNAPSTVWVPGGAARRAFTATAQQVSSAVTACLIVNSGGGAVMVLITVEPAVAPAPLPQGPGLFGVWLSTPAIHGGDTAAIIFQLDAPAPNSGMPVSISSSDPAIALPPSIVTVEPGMVVGVGFVPTQPVASPRTVTFTLRSGSSTKSISLVVY
jgi:hypothetical protein